MGSNFVMPRMLPLHLELACGPRVHVCFLLSSFAALWSSRSRDSLGDQVGSPLSSVHSKNFRRYAKTGLRDRLTVEAFRIPLARAVPLCSNSERSEHLRSPTGLLKCLVGT